MTDEIKGLVTRLNSAADAFKDTVAPGTSRLLTQAAAALTLSDEARVRAEGQLRHAREASVILSGDPEAVETYRALRAERDAFAGQVEFIRLCRDSTTESLLAAEARAQASEALVRELVEGLRPFGMLAEKWGIDDPNWDDDDIMLFANREGRLSEPPLLLVVGDFRKAQALILRAGNLGSSRADIAAPVASQPDCSAAQSLDGKGEL